MRKVLVGIVGLGIAVAFGAGVVALNKRAEADRIRTQAAQAARAADSVRNQTSDFVRQANETDRRVGELQLRISGAKGDAANLANAFVDTAAYRTGVIALINESLNNGALTDQQREHLEQALANLRSGAAEADSKLATLELRPGQLDG